MVTVWLLLNHSQTQYHSIPQYTTVYHSTHISMCNDCAEAQIHPVHPRVDECGLNTFHVIFAIFTKASD